MWQRILLSQEMCEQEKHHLATFEKILPEQRIRPTALLPFWNIAGFALGIVAFFKSFCFGVIRRYCDLSQSDWQVKVYTCNLRI